MRCLKPQPDCPKCGGKLFSGLCVNTGCAAYKVFAPPPRLSSPRGSSSPPPASAKPQIVSKFTCPGCQSPLAYDPVTFFYTCDSCRSQYSESVVSTWDETKKAEVLSKPPEPACDCGALIAKTTHARWCALQKGKK